MAFESSDGKKFSMSSRKRQHDKGIQGKMDMGKTDPLATPNEGEESPEDMGMEDPSQVASEHGPATEVHMMHDHEAGSHQVHSTHPDGHTHMSEHGSAEEAHEHGKKLAGGGGDDEGGEGEY